MLKKVSRISLIILSVLVVSCSTIKNEWGNFTAYYNTFYNAKDFYKKGFDAVLKAQPTYQAGTFIRITEIPSKAGYADFDKAVDKGAKILREYEKTKWVDNALLLIGKSYFFQSNFFSAEEKFTELYNSSKDQLLTQEAVLWKARSFYELRQYEKVLEYIDEEINAIDLKWDPVIHSNLLIVQVEALIKSEEIGAAKNSLIAAMPHIEEKRYKASSWFLLGQLQEAVGSTEEALKAYSNAASLANDYQLQIIAKRKQAEIARNNGDYKKALKLFTEMSRDDKNYDIIYDLYYEIGFTYELMGEYKKAETTLRETLYNPIKKPEKETAAKAYYRMAQIYLDHYKDIHRAAAYFDSAKTAGNGLLNLPVWFNATELAKSYNEYTGLNKKRVRFDSLLYLSTLSKTQLDSVIKIIQLQRKNEMDQLRKQQAKESSSMINLGATAGANQTQETQGENGFLNYRNPVLVQQSNEAFRALWGSRPLADNWRVLELVKREKVNEDEKANEAQQSKDVDNQQNLMAFKIDLSEIPFEESKKTEMREELSKVLYEIGNIFYLNLSKPDSAIRYYQKIINTFPQSSVRTQAKYALSELYAEYGNLGEAQSLAEEVNSELPLSSYADKVRKRYTLTLPDSLKSSDSLTVTLSSQLAEAQTLNDSAKAEFYKNIALEQKDPQLTGKLLSLTIETYINEAKRDETFEDRYIAYNEAKLDWSSLYAQHNARRDSLRPYLTDSLRQNDSAAYASIKKWVDSTITQPDFSKEFPYLGTYWDSTRSALKLLKSKSAQSVEAKRLEPLSAELAIPESIAKQMEKKAKTALSDSTKANISLPDHQAERTENEDENED